jgi:hypothetical protein
MAPVEKVVREGSGRTTLPLVQAAVPGCRTAPPRRREEAETATAVVRSKARVLLLSVVLSHDSVPHWYRYG